MPHKVTHCDAGFPLCWRRCHDRGSVAQIPLRQGKGRVGTRFAGRPSIAKQGEPAPGTLGPRARAWASGRSGTPWTCRESGGAGRRAGRAGWKWRFPPQAGMFQRESQEDGPNRHRKPPLGGLHGLAGLRSRRYRPRYSDWLVFGAFAMASRNSLIHRSASSSLYRSSSSLPYESGMTPLVGSLHSGWPISDSKFRISFFLKSGSSEILKCQDTEAIGTSSASLTSARISSVTLPEKTTLEKLDFLSTLSLILCSNDGPAYGNVEEMPCSSLFSMRSGCGPNASSASWGETLRYFSVPNCAC